MSEDYRIEKDSMGEVKVPISAMYGAQTQRAIENFPISGKVLPIQFIKSLAYIKIACAQSNRSLKKLSDLKAESIIQAAQQIVDGNHYSQFPIDVFQTGSGTSTNMNMNEVISYIAKQNGVSIHPNDDVNMSQSSNDVIPTAIHVSSSIAINNNLIPAMEHITFILDNKKSELKNIVKTGRTHLMDAMPVTFEQTLETWKQQILNNMERIKQSFKRLNQLPQGGTAVGTGINANPKFGSLVSEQLSKITGIPFTQMPNLFVGISSQDTAVEISGQLNVLATSMMKIANDLRWMNSGPLSGLGEIKLPELQPGSSIMPGKVNPVIPEAVSMVAAQIMGNHSAITIGGQSGNFELNTMLPMIANNLLESINIASNALTQLADKAISNFSVNKENIKANLDNNPILVTALNSIIGYEKGSKIAKNAYKTHRSILEVALEKTDLDEVTLKKYLNPIIMTTNKT